jgi:hypothetical protein
MYDPDLTATGHQPMGFDQLSSLYARYQVFKSEIIARKTDFGSNTTSTSIKMGLVGNMDYGAWAGEVPEQMGEACYGKYVIANTHLGSRLVTLRNNLTTSEISGSETANHRGSYGWQSTVGSNPAYPWYWTLAFLAADGITTIAGVEIAIEIHYEAVFFQRTVLDSS